MRITLFAAALCGLAFTATAEGQPPGMMSLSLPGERALTAHALYPSTGGSVEPFAANAVWQGTSVQVGGTPTDGAKPLVVLSHGVWGNRFNQVWLAERLVSEGYIVLALDHPGTSTWDRNREEAARLWERPRDLSRLLDTFFTAPEWAEAVDASRIFAVGHSLGGYSVLAAAGARFDADRLATFCEVNPTAIACTVFTELGVGDDPADKEALGADLSDRRLTGVIALDPGGVPAIVPESLTSTSTPIAVISAGRTPYFLNPAHEAKALAGMADIEHVAFADAGHFDFLGVCTDKGAEILRYEESSAAIVCEEGPTPRADLHPLIADQVVRILAGFTDR